MVSRDVYNAFKNLKYPDREKFYSILFDAKNKVIGVDMASQRLGTSSLVHPAKVYKSAPLASVASVIFVHSHPSGDPEPSADKELTRQLKEAGDLLAIEVLDHVIIGRNKYCSFANKREICLIRNIFITR